MKMNRILPVRGTRINTDSNEVFLREQQVWGLGKEDEGV